MVLTHGHFDHLGAVEALLAGDRRTAARARRRRRVDHHRRPAAGERLRLRRELAAGRSAARGRRCRRSRRSAPERAAHTRSHARRHLPLGRRRRGPSHLSSSRATRSLPAASDARTSRAADGRALALSIAEKLAPLAAGDDRASRSRTGHDDRSRAQAEPVLSEGLSPPLQTRMSARIVTAVTVRVSHHRKTTSSVVPISAIGRSAHARI